MARKIECVGCGTLTDARVDTKVVRSALSWLYAFGLDANDVEQTETYTAVCEKCGASLREAVKNGGTKPNIGGDAGQPKPPPAGDGTTT